jgi:tetratricopeptide (TPR) repeat protein/tRNA A-37 threonylcarbamoyl transferase component Bud32
MSDPRSEARVAAVLESYLAAARAGRAPDRDALLAAHPGLEAPLKEALLGLAFVEDAGSVLALPDPGPPRVLGDFRIVAEVGRGGMGVVYEAEQVSLRRRVALKVLPFAGVLDPKHLQRFRNEAQAAAHLHHTNIVPVYSVGSERGVHYYAMQFIEGESLARAISDLKGGGTGEGPRSPISSHGSNREPAYLRMAARIGMQAAEALDHAHQLGIVHRDVKPGNLLVDAAGNLWITDFGLARFSSEPALTVTGDLVGTFRYMSPEQALAKRVPIDHRTDVYSLGATLYELVTLEPAVKGEDPQAVLQEIAFKDPTAARRLNPAIPPELETILQKAMWKDPAGRYATAQEMADDLRRFLEHIPIRARPPTLLDRATKLARRHRTAVRVGAGFLALLLVGLAAGMVLLAREKGRTDRNYALALAERKQAQDNLAVACEAVDEMLAKVGHIQLENIPMLEHLRRDLLDKAAVFYQGLLERHGDDPDLRHDLGETWRRLSHIRGLLGDEAQAREAIEEAVKRLDPLVQEFPGVEKYRSSLSAALDELGDDRRAVAVWDGVNPVSSGARKALAGAHMNFGLTLGHQGDDAGQESEIRKGLGILEELLRDAPEDRYLLGVKHMALANLRTILIERGLDREAAVAYREAVDLAERLLAGAPHEVDSRSLCAREHHNFGVVLSKLGRSTEALSELRRSLELFEGLARDFPSIPGYRNDVGVEHHTLARALVEAGGLQNLQDAERHCAEAVKFLGHLAQERGGVSLGLAWTHWSFVRVLKAQGRIDEAEDHARIGMDLCTRLVADAPGNAENREVLAGIQNDLGRMLREGGRPEEAEALYRAAIAQHAAIDKLGLLSDSDRHERGTVLVNLGNLLSEAGKTSEAEDLYRDVIRDLGSLVATNPDSSAYRSNLANAWLRLGVVLKNTGKAQEAEACYEEARKQHAELVQLYPDVLVHRERLASCLDNLADHLSAGGQRADAEEALRKAIEQWDWMARVRGTAGDRSRLAKVLLRLGDLLLRTRPADADVELRRGIELGEELVREAPGNPDYQSVLGAVLHNHAMALWNTGQREGVRELYERAIGCQRAALAVEPDNATARRYLVLHYQGTNEMSLVLGDHARAAAAAVALAEANPSNWQSRLQGAGRLVRAAHLALGDERVEMAERARLVRTYVEQAKAIVQDLTPRCPDTAKDRDFLADEWCNVGFLLKQIGTVDEALACFEEARKLYELVRERPDGHDYKSDMARCLGSLGQMLVDERRPGEAEEAFRESLELRKEMVIADPSAANRDLLADIMDRYGMFLLSDRTAEAEAVFREGLELREIVAREQPGNPAYQTALAGTLHNHANAISKLGQREEAVEIYERAIGLERQALAADPGTRSARVPRPALSDAGRTSPRTRRPRQGRGNRVRLRRDVRRERRCALPRGDSPRALRGARGEGRPRAGRRPVRNGETLRRGGEVDAGQGRAARAGRGLVPARARPGLRARRGLEGRGRGSRRGSRRRGLRVAPPRDRPRAARPREGGAPLVREGGRLRGRRRGPRPAGRGRAAARDQVAAPAPPRLPAPGMFGPHGRVRPAGMDPNRRNP